MTKTQLTAASLIFFGGALNAAALTLTPLDLKLVGSTAQPNVVAAKTGFVLSWQQKNAAGCTTLYTAALDAHGNLGAAKPVASGCNWFVNWIDFPSVSIAKNGDWLSYWLQKSKADPYAYDIHVTRSINAGQSWSTSVIPHTDATPTEHGFVSMTPLSGDRVLMIWLDGRNTLADSAHGDHGHGAEAPMTLRSAEIDRAGALHHAQEIDARVCSCCSTDLATDAAGAIALFRDRSDAEIRDIAQARYQGSRWQPTKSVNKDGWKIAGCPTNGPSLAVIGKRAAAFWPTLVAGQFEVRAKYLDRVAQPVLLEKGAAVLGRPDAASFGAGVLVSWLGQNAGGASALKLRLLNARLETLSEVNVAELTGGRNIGVPKLAVYQDQAILVWTEAESAGISHVRGVRVAYQ